MDRHYICREILVNRIKRQYPGLYECGLQGLMQSIRDADVEPRRRGYWKKLHAAHNLATTTWECSCCRQTTQLSSLDDERVLQVLPRCPKCGAYMVCSSVLQIFETAD